MFILFIFCSSTAKKACHHSLRSLSSSRYFFHGSLNRSSRLGYSAKICFEKVYKIQRKPVTKSLLNKIARSWPATFLERDIVVSSFANFAKIFGEIFCRTHVKESFCLGMSELYNLLINITSETCSF